MSTAALSAALLFVFAPPPAPEDAEGQTPAGDADDSAAADEPPAPPPKTDTTPREVDSRGYPIMRYSEADQDPGRELEWAEETPPPPELEYAEETPEEERVGVGEGVERPAPSQEALERQGPAALTSTTGGRTYSGESPQRFAFELKFGPYLPNVDRNFSGDGLGPYANIYGPTDDTGASTGQPKPGLFSAIAFDYQFVYLGGPLSVGTSVGFFRDSAQALIAEPEPDAETIRSPADKTRFNVIPVTLLAGYRFELLADRWRVPLVPYAKGGLAYGFWWSTDGNKKISVNSRDEKGRGGSIGWQVNAGMMLRLDFIERGSSRDLDRITGINHTYLFGEYQISRMSGFGSGNRVDVGDDTWLVGLAIEF